MLSPYALSSLGRESHGCRNRRLHCPNLNVGTDQRDSASRHHCARPDLGGRSGTRSCGLPRRLRCHSLRPFERAALGTGVYLACFDVAPAAVARATPVLLYAAARQARVARRTTVLLDPRSVADSLLTLGHFQPLPKASSYSGRVWNIMLYKAAQACHEVRQPLLSSFLTGEVIETVYAFVARMYRTSFFKAVQEGTLTRAQYISLLSPSHHYVRYTTRILGRCIAHAGHRHSATTSSSISPARSIMS